MSVVDIQVVRPDVCNEIELKRNEDANANSC